MILTSLEATELIKQLFCCLADEWCHCSVSHSSDTERSPCILITALEFCYDNYYHQVFYVSASFQQLSCIGKSDKNKTTLQNHQGVIIHLTNVFFRIMS